jgi:hypothetical protein
MSCLITGQKRLKKPGLKPPGPGDASVRIRVRATCASSMEKGKGSSSAAKAGMGVYMGTQPLGTPHTNSCYPLAQIGPPPVAEPSAAATCCLSPDTATTGREAQIAGAFLAGFGRPRERPAGRQFFPSVSPDL